MRISCCRLTMIIQLFAENLRSCVDLPTFPKNHQTPLDYCNTARNAGDAHGIIPLAFPCRLTYRSGAALMTGGEGVVDRSFGGTLLISTLCSRGGGGNGSHILKEREITPRVASAFPSFSTPVDIEIESERPPFAWHANLRNSPPCYALVCARRWKE